MAEQLWCESYGSYTAYICKLNETLLVISFCHVYVLDVNKSIQHSTLHFPLYLPKSDLHSVYSHGTKKAHHV